MGGIGIWCLHFIGNRAIILSSGASHAQIAYSARFTALSFLLPIGVLLFAFFFIGTSDSANGYRVTLGGTLTGGAVCGMHYVGQLGIANYTCIYDWPHALGAGIFAVFASLIALTVFFRMRAAWVNVWWKRALCAMLLAGAVSGMHWLATVGTLYRYKGVSPTSRSQLTRKRTVIVVIALVYLTTFPDGTWADLSDSQSRPASFYLCWLSSHNAGDSDLPIEPSNWSWHVLSLIVLAAC